MSFKTVYADLCALLAKKGLVVATQVPSWDEGWEMESNASCCISERNYESTDLEWAADWLIKAWQQTRKDREDTKTSKWALTASSNWESPPLHGQGEITRFTLNRYEQGLPPTVWGLCGDLHRLCKEKGYEFEAGHPTAVYRFISTQWGLCCPYTSMEEFKDRAARLTIIADSICMTRKQEDKEGTRWELRVTLDTVVTTNADTKAKPECMFVFHMTRWTKHPDYAINADPK